jgi:hypothetical protein
MYSYFFEKFPEKGRVFKGQVLYFRHRHKNFSYSFDSRWFLALDFCQANILLLRLAWLLGFNFSATIESHVIFILHASSNTFSQIS